MKSISTYCAVSLLEQEEHRQHAEEEKRRSQPRHVVDRKSGDSHQCQHHQKEHECDAAALYNSVSRIIFEGTPENERVKEKKPDASCHVYSVGGQSSHVRLFYSEHARLLGQLLVCRYRKLIH